MRRENNRPVERGRRVFEGISSGGRFADVANATVLEWVASVMTVPSGKRSSQRGFPFPSAHF